MNNSGVELHSTFLPGRLTAHPASASPKSTSLPQSLVESLTTLEIFLWGPGQLDHPRLFFFYYQCLFLRVKDYLRSTLFPSLYYSLSLSTSYRNHHNAFKRWDTSQRWTKDCPGSWRCFSGKGKNDGQTSLMTSEFILQLQSPCCGYC